VGSLYGVEVGGGAALLLSSSDGVGDDDSFGADSDGLESSAVSGDGLSSDILASDAGGSLDGTDVSSLVASLEPVDEEVSSSPGLGSEKTVESLDVVSVESLVVSLS